MGAHPWPREISRSCCFGFPTSDVQIGDRVNDPSGKIDRLEREVLSLRGVALRDEGHSTLITIEMSRMVDMMSEVKTDMHGIKGLLGMLVQAQPVMRDPVEDEADG